MIITPTFYEKEGSVMKNYDVFSRLMEDRVVMLFSEVNDDLAATVISQLLYLESIDPDEDIHLYINSPGGSVSAGLAIYDTIKKIKCDVSTICVGMAASMGAVLLASGAKGKRYVLPNSQVMIHQVLGGTEGQASDIVIAAEHIKTVKQRLNEILSKETGKKLSEIEKDTDRNNWMFGEEAKDYGIVDQVVEETT